jgi:LacI family gluconate utilization system Gnt-I transcriptional repressor
MEAVARHAGVGTMTVSRFFASPDAVSAELRQRIDQAVRTLDYVPNRIAGGLASARSRAIPVLVPSLANAVYADIIQGVHDALVPTGYQLLLANTGFSLAEEEALVATFLGWSPHGVILTGIDHTPAARSMLASARIPVVETMELGKRSIDANVGFSHREAGRAMAERLVARGYRRMAFAGARMDLDARAHRRCQGHQEALRRHGLPTDRVCDLSGPTKYDQGAEVVDWLLRQRPAIDAICCHHDVLAVGVLLECQRRAIAVPGRLAITGFNGLDITAAMTPRVTTVISPRYRIGQEAGRLLLRRLEGKDGGRRIDVGFEIAERETTRAVTR